MRKGPNLVPQIVDVADVFRGTRAAALDDEVGDEPVEGESVVVPAPGMPRDPGHRGRRQLGVQRDFERPAPGTAGHLDSEASAPETERHGHRERRGGQRPRRRFRLGSGPLPDQPSGPGHDGRIEIGEVRFDPRGQAGLSQLAKALQNRDPGVTRGVLPIQGDARQRGFQRRYRLPAIGSTREGLGGCPHDLVTRPRQLDPIDRVRGVAPDLHQALHRGLPDIVRRVLGQKHEAVRVRHDRCGPGRVHPNLPDRRRPRPAQDQPGLVGGDPGQRHEPVGAAMPAGDDPNLTAMGLHHRIDHRPDRLGGAGARWRQGVERLDRDRRHQVLECPDHRGAVARQEPAAPRPDCLEPHHGCAIGEQAGEYFAPESGIGIGGPERGQPANLLIRIGGEPADHRVGPIGPKQRRDRRPPDPRSVHLIFAPKDGELAEPRHRRRAEIGLPAREASPGLDRAGGVDHEGQGLASLEYPLQGSGNPADQAAIPDRKPPEGPDRRAQRSRLGDAIGDGQQQHRHAIRAEGVLAELA